jgi:hypothetical protein
MWKFGPYPGGVIMSTEPKRKYGTFILKFPMNVHSPQNMFTTQCVSGPRFMEKQDNGLKVSALQGKPDPKTCRDGCNRITTR